MYLLRDNAKIYYEVCGEGDALILIHGVITDSGLFDQASRILSDKFRVVIFDRRGNSRSRTSVEAGKSVPAFDIEEQAEDIMALMDELGIDRAYIAGASAGAVIGHCFLCKYPERVRHLIMYEPALLGHMRKEDPLFREWAEKTEALVDAGKLNSALIRFAEHIGPADKRSPLKPEESFLREMGNLEYAMKSEIPGLHAYDPEPEIIKKYADMITIAAGEKSGETVYVREARRLADMMGSRVLYYPGGHNLPYDIPAEFAVCVSGTITLKQIIW